MTTTRCPVSRVGGHFHSCHFANNRQQSELPNLAPGGLQRVRRCRRVSPVSGSLPPDMARGFKSPGYQAPLPKVSFVLVQDDDSAQLAGVHDQQARSYGCAWSSTPFCGVSSLTLPTRQRFFRVSETGPLYSVYRCVWPHNGLAVF